MKHGYHILMRSPLALLEPRLTIASSTLLSPLFITLKIGGQLYRQGAAVAILPGKQTWGRAWYYGLRMVVHYVDLQQRMVVHVQSTRAWEAWQHAKHADVFHDLRELITWDQKQRIKVLCTSPKQLKEMPKNEWSLRNRMADAAKAGGQGGRTFLAAADTRARAEGAGLEVQADCTLGHPAHQALDE